MFEERDSFHTQKSLSLFAECLKSGTIVCVLLTLYKFMFIVAITSLSSSSNMRPHSFFPPCAIFLQFTACLAATYKNCSSPNFNCAGVNMSYPFGILNQGCGLPGFQVTCDGNPRIHVHGNEYKILNASLISQRKITIVNEKLFERCHLDPDVYEDLNNSSFFVSHQNSNITELRDCGKKIPKQIVKFDCNRTDGFYQWYLGFGEEGSASCSEVYAVPVLEKPKTVPKNSSQFIQLLRRGFQVEWKDPKITFPDCGKCEATKGVCGYHPYTETFCCYCPGGQTHLYDCSDGLVINSPYHHQTKSIGASVIIGAGIGVSTLLVVAVLLVIAYRKKISSFSRQVLRRKRYSPQAICKVETFLHNYVDQMPTRYSYSGLKKITNNFAHKLGEGGFGVVYKGSLPGGNFVAVKMLDRSRDSETQFMNEVATIGRIHHIHLIRLLGYCFEGITSALVYEYMANGSLDKFILARKEEDQILNWDQLYKIALGAARGIAYLHGECHNRIIHFDIKPHNILLDEEFTAKVADFGLAKLCGIKDEHVSMTAARGTPGYVAPEVWSRNLGSVTDKSDVYSFGMMLLEMVGGRKNIDIQVSRSSQFYFPDWAIKLVESGELRTRLRERELSEADEAKARSMTKVGVWCIQYNSTDRPSMLRVLQMLEGDANDIPNPATPLNARPGPTTFSASDESSSIGIEMAS